MGIYSIDCFFMGGNGNGKQDEVTMALGAPNTMVPFNLAGNAAKLRKLRKLFSSDQEID